MSTYRCSVHGVVKPKFEYYSCPGQADCPECGERMEDEDGGIKILTERESVLRRPHLHKKELPEIYEKYKDEIEEE